jgi:hypothetical protein
MDQPATMESHLQFGITMNRDDHLLRDLLP